MTNAVVWGEPSGKIRHIMFLIQQEVPFIGKDSTNPHFKSKYASLEDIWSTLRPVLSKHGVLLSQVPGCIKDGAIEVVTQLIHVESGEFVLSCGYMPMGKEGPQAAGSAITYARRYFLCPLLGIVAGEDDDAEAAEGRSEADLAKLRKRKEEVLKKISAIPGVQLTEWVSQHLGRQVDSKLTLNSEAEIAKLEIAVNVVPTGKKA